MATTKAPAKRGPASFGRGKPKPSGPKRIKFWSFSVYSTYKECPRRAKRRVIDRVKEPGNAAMQRGNDIHKSAEDYIKGVITKKQLHEALVDIIDELNRLRKIYKDRSKLGVKGHAPVVETTWAFTATWDETTWDDWVYCWLRIKLDVGHWEPGEIYVPTDWKSGKYNESKNEEYIEQLELYALAALLLLPHAKEVRPRLVYVDEGLVYPDPADPLIFTHADIPRLKALWAKRIRAMLNDTNFAPRPGYYCKRCPDSKANGGTCKY